MKIDHVYCFCSYSPVSASVRYRIKYVMEELGQKENISSTIVYPGYTFTNTFRFIFTWFSVLLFRKKNSLVLFQKIHTRRSYSTLLKTLLFFRRKHTIYDTDDADYLRYPSGTIHFFIKNSSLCTVGSRSLFNYAKTLNHNVLLLTSPVIAHAARKRSRNEVFTIGWTGEYNSCASEPPYSHVNNLNTFLFPAIKNLDFECRLVLMGVLTKEDAGFIQDYFRENTNIRLMIPEQVNWEDEESIYREISQFDIGVAPLIDHPFNQAKSAFKLKQYLSCGVPVLASPTGENLNFLTEGENGYFCQSANDFFEKIQYIRNRTDDEYNELSQKALHSSNKFTIKGYCSGLLSYYDPG